MRKFLPTVVYFTVLVSCAQSQNRTNQFRYEKGRFEISFPTKPEMTKQTNNTEYGKITIFSFKSEPKSDDNLSYEVHYLDYPKNFADTLTNEQTYELFNGSQTTNINSPNLQLIGTFNYNKLKYTGREYRWQDTESKIFSRVRFLMVGNRMYIFAVNTGEKSNFNVAINKFLDSFELINTGPNLKHQDIIVKSETIFKINFPSQTEVREMEVPTEYGNAKIKAELYQPKLDNDKNLIYMVAALEYPKDITQSDGFDLKSYYSDVVRAALAGRQSILIGQKDISQDGISGIEVKESFKGGQIIIKQRTFLKGSSQITIQVMTIPENDENESMNKFLDSFEFRSN